MRHKHCSLVLAAAALSLLCQSALAQDSGPEFKFSGFGTLGMTSTDNDNAEFRTGFRQDRGANKTADFGVDSRLGLQLNGKFNSTFSGVAQVMVNHVDGKDTPRVEWLYGQAAVAPWLDVRVGRLVVPAFMVSDSLNVGYAMHWMRPPSDAYGLYPVSSFDGVQTVLRTQWGSSNVSAQISAGNSITYLYLPSKELNSFPKSDVSNLLGVNLQLENGSWLFRLGQVGATVQGGDAPPEATAKFDDSFTGAGVQYDDGKLLVMAEYLTRRTTNGNALIPDGTLNVDAAYISAGYRFGNLMPYVTLSQFKSDVPDGYFLTKDAQRTSAIGLRWDVYKNVALKAQYESDEPSIQFVNVKQPLSSLPTINVLSLAVDFVF